MKSHAKHFGAHLSQHVAYVIDPHFVMPAGVSIKSLLSNSRGNDINIHVISPLEAPLSQTDLKHLEQICTQHGASISFYSASLASSKHGEALISSYQPPRNRKRITTTALLKFLIPELLPHEIDVVLYLDADTLVRGPLDGLFAVDLGDTYAGVVFRQPTVPVVAERTRTLEIDKYFNSGVMLLNVRQWRKDDVNSQIPSLVEGLGTKNRRVDQDILNMLLDRKTTSLDHKFNTFRYPNMKRVWEFIPKQEVVIFHYILRQKPWTTFWCKEWNQTYAKTPFGSKASILARQASLAAFSFSKTPLMITILGAEIRIRLNLRPFKHLAAKSVSEFGNRLQSVHKRRRRKLAQSLGNLRANVVERRIRRSFRQGRPLRIVFLCSEGVKWPYLSVYRRMIHDPKFDPVVVVTRRRPPNRGGSPDAWPLMDENADFLQASKVPYVDGFDGDTPRDLRVFSPDVVFYDQPYGLPAQHQPAAINRVALTAFVPYGYGFYIASRSKQAFKASMRHEVWRLYLETLDFIDLDEKRRFRSTRNARFVGYPKMDELISRRRNSTVDGISSHVSSHEKTVIFAPHWTVGPHDPNLVRSATNRFGTFEWSGPTLLEFAKSRSQWRWLFKPHPRLWHAISGLDDDCREHLERTFREWETLSAINMRNAPYIEEFHNSDLLITDSGSFLVEFQFTAKPLIHLVTAFSQYSSMGHRLVDGHQRVSDREELLQVLQDPTLWNTWVHPVILEKLERGQIAGESLIASLLHDLDN